MRLWTFNDRPYDGAWHRWFAWRPVMVWGGGVLRIVWLETVWRKWDQEPYPFDWASCFIYLDGDSAP